MSTATCLLVGLGQAGMTFDIGKSINTQVMSHARALAMTRGLDLVGAVDPDTNARSAFSNIFRRRAFPTIEQALLEVSPEIVVIAAPTETHLSLVERVCQYASPKVVLCEKPLSYQMADAYQIVEICEKNNIQLFVNYMRRLDRATQEIKELIFGGGLGPFSVGTCFYSNGLINNASHFVDILQFWFGKPSVLDSSFVVGDKAAADDAIVNFSLLFEDLQIEFRALVKTPTSQLSLFMWGSRNRLDYDLGGRRVNVMDLTIPVTDLKENGGFVIESSLAHVQLEVTEALKSVCEGNTTKLCTGREALSTLKICHEAIDQAKQGNR